MAHNASTTEAEKAARRQTARDAAAAIRRSQERAAKRSRILALAALGLVIAVIAGVAVWVNSQDTGPRIQLTLPLDQVQDVPAVALPDGGIPVDADGAATADVDPQAAKVGIWFDYMCPACGAFEQVQVDTVKEFLADDSVQVVLHPLSFLDASSQGSAFSTRAATALAWVADLSPAQTFAFHDAVIVNQPAQGTTGPSDADLADLAVSIGVPQEVADGIADGLARDTFEQWVVSATNAWTDNDALADAQGGFGTPTVSVDGVRLDGVDFFDPAALRAAVLGD